MGNCRQICHPEIPKTTLPNSRAANDNAMKYGVVNRYSGGGGGSQDGVDPVEDTLSELNSPEFLLQCEICGQSRKDTDLKGHFDRCHFVTVSQSGSPNPNYLLLCLLCDKISHTLSQHSTHLSSSHPYIAPLTSSTISVQNTILSTPTPADSPQVLAYHGPTLSLMSLPSPSALKGGVAELKPREYQVEGKPSANGSGGWWGSCWMKGVQWKVWSSDGSYQMNSNGGYDKQKMLGDLVWRWVFGGLVGKAQFYGLEVEPENETEKETVVAIGRVFIRNEL